MTTVRLVKSSELDGDVLVIGTVPGPRKGGAVFAPGKANIAPAAVKKINDALAATGASGKAGEIVSFLGAAVGLRYTTVHAIGLGSATADSTERTNALRDGAAAALRASAGSKKVVFAAPINNAEDVLTASVGAQLGAYQFNNYKSQAPKKGPAKAVALTVADPRNADVRQALATANTVAESVCFARDLINTPAADLHPDDLAQAVAARAMDLGLDVEILDEEQLVEGGYGGIVGVGQGAADPPRLARIAYRPKGAKKHVALIGKGITYDTGGYDMKPAMSMGPMKGDMSGAAAVAATICAAAELGLNVNITAYLCIAENMVSGTATRPADVLTMYNGKTVEVNNTDAEGRLVMADGLARSAEDNPDVVIDVATLTGAMVVALGDQTAGYFANDDELAADIDAASKASGEPFWRMPLLDHLRPSLDSSVADLSNIGGR
ncbi:MAG: putative cytosol aminopeptidase, partial [Actinomycetota bacterium]